MQAEAQPGLKFNEVERKAEESEAIYIHIHVDVWIFIYTYIFLYKTGFAPALCVAVGGESIQGAAADVQCASMIYERFTRSPFTAICWAGNKGNRKKG